MFDLFDFTPVNDGPFKGQGTPTPAKGFKYAQPNQNEDALVRAAAIPTNMTLGEALPSQENELHGGR